ncbi:flagellar export chaperone FlgN [Buchnera aphidicola]|uniref:Flagellar biosynthesis protein FlgN n=1 Tax=Buchnera aphidicola (Aphis nerii) TaxID=1241835 RepID=A0A4D6XNT7_9GAMM|nr:flagellar export chaperone FlgN [Buchnera aphidicola]QCI18872.1 flagellar biosynthesis protein FlgN [Buchnera aphidicola (Aphis nerii)]
MNELIDIFQEMDKILFLLHKIIHKEYVNLLESKVNIKKLFSLIEKKNYLLNKLAYKKKIQLSLEKSYNIYAPYLKFDKLNYFSNRIRKKCIVLNKMNLKNKDLMQHKFYINQKFLNFCKSYKNHTIYNSNGNLED